MHRLSPASARPPGAGTAPRAAPAGPILPFCQGSRNGFGHVLPMKAQPLRLGWQRCVYFCNQPFLVILHMLETCIAQIRHLWENT